MINPQDLSIFLHNSQIAAVDHLWSMHRTVISYSQIKVARAEAEEALHIKRRKEVWEDLQREKEEKNSGGISPTIKRGKGSPQEFAADLAAVMPGVGKPQTAKREINRKIARVEKLGSDLQKIAGTSLDKGVEMDALISSSDGGAGIT